MYLNWSAPSTLKKAAKTAQVAACQSVLGLSERNIGILLQPEFTHKKNQLWMVENAHLKDLATAGLSVDKSFILMFKDKVLFSTQPTVAAAAALTYMCHVSCRLGVDPSQCQVHALVFDLRWTCATSSDH